MALEIVPAQDVPLPEQARVFSDAFAGYVGGSFAMDSAGLARFICAQGAEVCFSRFVRNAERLCGFGYITRTGDVARVSGMGVVPQARRQGVARKLLLHLIAEAKARGDRLMVFGSNRPKPRRPCLVSKRRFSRANPLMRLAPSGRVSAE